MSEAEQTTLHLILSAAMQEFLEKGYKSASLRNIVKTAGVTTGAFYGYYNSKEDLFEALVGEHYDFLLKLFCKAQKEIADSSTVQTYAVFEHTSYYWYGSCRAIQLYGQGFRWTAYHFLNLVRKLPYIIFITGKNHIAAVQICFHFYKSKCFKSLL